MNSQLVAQTQDHTVGFMNSGSFELSQRVASMFTKSTLVPKEYQSVVFDSKTGQWVNNEQALSNCVIALNMAQRVGADPLMVMQNLVVVHGRPTWSSQFLIATFNSCGKFSSLRYEFFGEKDTDSYGCRATATERETGEKLTGTDVTIAIAKAEGWYGKNGSKWKTMPQQMLQYRAAAWFIRTIAPELSMGLHTQDEIIDIETIDVTPTREKPAVTPAKEKVKSRSVDSLVGGDAETVIEAAQPATQVQKVQEAPQVQQAPQEEFFQQESQWETMPMPELEPETAPAPKPPYVNLHDQWRAKVDQWQTPLDVTNGLNEMPPVIKLELKEYYTERNEIIKAELAKK